MLIKGMTFPSVHLVNFRLQNDLLVGEEETQPKKKNQKSARPQNIFSPMVLLFTLVGTGQHRFDYVMIMIIDILQWQRALSTFFVIDHSNIFLLQNTNSFVKA